MNNEITLFLVSLEEGFTYFTKAKKWSDQTAMFGDSIRVSTATVAEYLANQDGYTLFANCEGRKYVL